MEKPVELKIEELKNNIVKEINESKLPVFITKTIVKEIYDQLNNIYIQELSKKTKEYNEQKED